MNFIEELKMAERRVTEENYSSKMIVAYLANRKVYHSVAVLIVSRLFDLEQDIAEETVYTNKHYSAFKFEENPFNDEFLNGNTENQ